jgi:hypothetical protein
MLSEQLPRYWWLNKSSSATFGRPNLASRLSQSEARRIKFTNTMIYSWALSKRTPDCREPTMHGSGFFLLAYIITYGLQFINTVLAWEFDGI